MIADRVIRFASRLVPIERRADWLERWRGELWALAHADVASVAPWRFALGAIPDAWHEWIAGWRDAASLDGITGDLNRAWRAVWRSRAASLLTALIIGAGAAAFTSAVALVDATILRAPPAIARPAELCQIGRGPAADLDNFSYPNLRDLQDALAGVATLAAYGDRTVIAGSGSTAAVVAAQVVTAGFLDVAGVRVTDGPGVLSETEPGVVLSHRYWSEHSREIVAAGRWISIDGQPTPVAGVAPAGFVGLQTGGAEPAMWVSFGTALRAAPGRRVERGWSWLWTIGRRHPGVSVDAVRTAANAAHADFIGRSALHRATLGSGLVVVDGVGLRPADRAEALRLSRLLLTGAALVLFVALANVVGLQVARAIEATPVSAMMLAVGASRIRLVRSRLFELLMLTAGGAAVAWVAARVLTTFVRSTLPYPIAVPLEPQARAFLICTVASMAIVAALAVAPLARVTGAASIAALSSGLGRIGRRSRVTAVLVTLQLAVSAALLAAGGLLIRSVWAAGTADPGFDSLDVIVATLRPAQGSRPAAAVRADLVSRARAIAGVESVGLATQLPLSGSVETRTITKPGTTGLDAADRVPIVTFGVDRGFFDVLRVPFTAADDLRSPDGFTQLSVVVTATAADRLWPDAKTVQQIDTPRGPLRLAGVTRPMRLRSLRGSATPAMFLSIDASPDLPRYLIVRTARRDAAADVKHALSGLSADVIVMRVEPYAPMIAASLADTHMAARLTLPMAAIAVVLAMAGLYAAVSRRVVERRREFGVRLALGAQPSSIVRRVLRDVAVMTGIACAIGAGLFVAAATALRQLLFGVNPFDPMTLAAAVVLVAALAAIAAFVPARRAGSADPFAVLRDNG